MARGPDTPALEDAVDFQGEFPVLKSLYTLALPPGWEASFSWVSWPSVQAIQPPGSPHTTWTVELADIPAVGDEPSMPDARAVAGRLIVRVKTRAAGPLYFSGWADMGAWYTKLSGPRRVPDASVAEKARGLASASADPLAKIAALARFVQKDIRYVSVQIGVGGFQPHFATDILKNRYGDCKDKATLLAALLEASGIDSYYLIVNTSRGVVTPGSPVSLYGFNHAILAVRLPDDVPDAGLDSLVRHPRLGRLLIFDPTMPTTPLGRLPYYLQANTALLVDGLSGELVLLPSPQPEGNSVERTGKLVLSGDGTLSGEFREKRRAPPPIPCATGCRPRPRPTGASTWKLFCRNPWGPSLSKVSSSEISTTTGATSSSATASSPRPTPSAPATTSSSGPASWERRRSISPLATRNPGAIPSTSRPRSSPATSSRSSCRTAVPSKAFPPPGARRRFRRLPKPVGGGRRVARLPARIQARRTPAPRLAVRPGPRVLPGRERRGTAKPAPQDRRGQEASMPVRCHFRLASFAFSVLSAAALVAASALPARAQGAWPVIPDEERTMTDCPQQPGADALWLFREVVTDHEVFNIQIFKRMKILTDAGRDRANIEIPYYAGRQKVIDLEVRLVPPQGSPQPFTGQVFDKTAIRYRRYRIGLKSFAVPGVKAGSIIEFRYKIVPDEDAAGGNEEDLAERLQVSGKPEEGGLPKTKEFLSFPATRWEVQEDLFTRRARYEYISFPYIGYYFDGPCRLSWVAHKLESARPVIKGTRLELELEDIPAFKEEEYMTSPRPSRCPSTFSTSTGASRGATSSGSGRARPGRSPRRGSSATRPRPPPKARELVADAEDPALRLRRLYDGAQKIRNLSYEKGLTRKQKKEQKIKSNQSVAEVLEHGYGVRSDITRTFVALARAAGFEAEVVRVSNRDDKLFRINLLSFYDQMDAEAALVKSGDRTMVFDPATPFCPFGLVHWSRSNAAALRYSDKPPAFFTTTVYQPDLGLTQREIALKLDLQGGPHGHGQDDLHGARSARPAARPHPRRRGSPEEGLRERAGRHPAARGDRDPDQSREHRQQQPGPHHLLRCLHPGRSYGSRGQGDPPGLSAYRRRAVPAPPRRAPIPRLFPLSFPGVRRHPDRAARRADARGLPRRPQQPERFFLVFAGHRRRGAAASSMSSAI
ncbi:MAG: DUF3857 domain-containing protein [Candidatus Moduliflexus flocculans]|nr:DUF3857 domain-containing protein [Candidatus Moduliflexus flocculans]